MADSFDVAIAGGGVMGAALAFWLTELAPGKLSVAVVERDPSYARAATALSVASIRQQFSNPVNVRISRFGVEFIRDVGRWLGPEGGVRDLGFRENGYLFLAGAESTAATMREIVGMQRAEGAATELMEPLELARRFPCLALDGVVLGAFGPRDEGWFDNMGLLGGFRRAATARGVRFLRGEVAGFARAGDRIAALELSDGSRIGCGQAVNACGTRAPGLLRALGEEMPVEPRKRTVFIVDAPNLHAPDMPLLIDHTGFYIRPEGAHFLTATVPEADGPAEIDDYEPNLHEFEDVLWERLYARLPGCDAVKVVRAWAGQYDFNRLDQNAIVGRWPGYRNLYVMNGFSGHGLQQAPAIGRGMAELILSGRYMSLDLSELGPERIFSNESFLERAVV